MAQQKYSNDMPPRRSSAVLPEFTVRDFTYGYVDKVDETKLASGALKSSWNMISRIVGKISARNGQAYLNSTEIGSPGTGTHYPLQGIATFYTGSLKYLVAVANGVAYYCTPPAVSFIAFKTGLSTSAQVQFVTAMIDGVNCLLGFNGVDTPFKWTGVAAAQVETATVAGTITTAGNAAVIVTAAGMTGSPATLSVATALTDTASMVATKIRTAMEADAGISAFFTIGGTGADIVLTRKAAAANDATMNVSIDNGTCAGLTTAATSADTTAGIAPGVTDLQDYRIVNGEEPTTTDHQVYSLDNINIRTGTGKSFVFANDVLVDEGDYTLNETAGTITFDASRVNTVLNTDDDGETIAYPLNGIFVSPHVYLEGEDVKVYDKNNVEIVDDTNTSVTISNGSGAIPGQVTIQGGAITGATLTTSDHLVYTARYPFITGGTVVVKDKDNVTLTPTSKDGDAGTVTFSASQETKEPLTISYSWDIVDIMPITVAYKWADVITVDYQYSNGSVSSDYIAPCYHRGRIFVIDGSKIQWSDITENGSEYECWPPINTWGIQEGDGEECTIVLSVQNEAYIMKPSSIHRLRGNDLTDYRLDPIVGNIGCAGKRAGCVYNGTCYFVSETGLYGFDGNSATSLTDERIPLLWERINKVCINQAAVHVWHGLILFALPLDSSTTNNIVLAYDPKAGGIWPWSGMNILDWAEIITTSGTKLYSAENTQGFVVLQDTGTDDFGANITSYFEPMVFSGDMANREKKAKYIDIEYGPNQLTWGTIYASQDGAAYTEIPAYKKDGKVRRYKIRPTLNGKWRYIGLKILHDTADGFDLRSIAVPYKPKRQPKIKGDL